MSLKTLHRIGSELASTARQLEILSDPQVVARDQFASTVGLHTAGEPLRAAGIDILQINVGKVCNQTCAHCHVDAGPDRRESMSQEIAELVVKTLESSNIRTLDITGGAPEMNPYFRRLVERASSFGRHVIDRCNLTILLAPGFTDLPEFLAKHRVTVIASLPCYLESNCDAQRGDGVFQKSIAAIQRLNELGYAQSGTGIELHLVYNPTGLGLPPSQAKLEDDYRRHLSQHYGIAFSKLYTITNMPISRFLDDLLRRGEYATYMNRLVNAFNPATLAGLMCRNTLSVDWQGNLYDCDFNQMLDLPVAQSGNRHLRDFDFEALSHRHITTANHCFGCTAGHGSSCQGSVIAETR